MKTKGYVLKSKKTHKAKLDWQMFRTEAEALNYAKANGLRNYYAVRIVTL